MEVLSGSVGLEQAAAAYKENPTPETVTSLWQEFWAGAGKRVGRELTVEEFSGTAGDLTEHLRAGDMPIYVPQELAGQERRYLLGKIWPQMRSHSVQPGNQVSNEQPRSGWRWVEASLEAPYLGTTEPELERELANRGRDGQNETEYIIGAQASKLLTGHYFDEDTWSRLPGSREFGHVVSASFLADGNRDVVPYWLAAYRYGNLGGRSSEGV